MNWWEFRIPYVLAIRASFAVLGPTEFAAATLELILHSSPARVAGAARYPKGIALASPFQGIAPQRAHHNAEWGDH